MNLCFPKFSDGLKGFQILSDKGKIKIVLGEQSQGVQMEANLAYFKMRTKGNKIR